jgi:hypothetical protein
MSTKPGGGQRSPMVDDEGFIYAGSGSPNDLIKRRKCAGETEGPQITSRLDLSSFAFASNGARTSDRSTLHNRVSIQDSVDPGTDEEQSPCRSVRATSGSQSYEPMVVISSAEEDGYMGLKPHDISAVTDADAANEEGDAEDSNEVKFLKDVQHDWIRDETKMHSSTLTGTQHSNPIFVHDKIMPVANVQTPTNRGNLAKKSITAKPASKSTKAKASAIKKQPVGRSRSSDPKSSSSSASLGNSNMFDKFRMANHAR